MEARELKQIGSYKVRRFIAEGGMAWVFEVVDPRFEGREVVRALKMLKPDAALGDEFQRFISEASLLADIDHPNLVTIFDFGKDEATDCFYYTMTFVDGPTMAEHLAEHGPFSVKEAGRIFTSLLDGLAELHDRGIIHRDIKPANVLLGSDGRPRLADLGIARVEQERSVTRTGMAVGTVIYMSPNQARGQPVDASSDVFSVGLTLYEALTGRIVYENIDDLDSTSSHDVLGYLVSLGRTGDELEISYPPEASIPRALTAVIEKACRFHPEDRYPNARAMLEGLRTALLPAAPKVAAPRWPWLAAAGVTALAAAAAGLYWGIWVPMQTQTRVEGKLAAAAQLQESAPVLLERAKDLDPPPERELLESAERALERAQSYLVDGQEDFEVGSYSVAETSLERALRKYDTACDQLTGEHLRARADAGAAGVGERAARLREAGAQEHLPEAWTGLEAQVASLAASPGAATPPCTAAAAHLDRIDGARAAMAAAAALESKLGEVWPMLAATARNDALKAQKLAEAERVDAREYELASSRGQTAFAEGRRRDQAEEYLEARDEYRKAESHFRAAAAVVPAAKARAEVRRVEQDVAKGGLTVLGRASLLVADADARYQQGDWEEAARTYQEAVVAMRSRMAEADLEREAQRVRTDTLAAREAAAREGAEFSAPGPLARGDQARTEAEGALEAKRYQEAERGFQAAQSSYTEARSAAIEALAAAREVEIQLRQERERVLGGRDCAGFESSTARGECEAALADLQQGAEALAVNDAPSALRSYRASLAALERAAGAELRFEETKQWPPEIVSRSPRRESVEVYRNKSVTLAVEAKDRNAGDRLRYTWTADGERLPGGGPQIDYLPERSGRVTVTVDDGRGGAISESWQIAVENRKPDLSVIPTQAIGLVVGKQQLFTAEASDPDGDPVSTTFRLAGETVGTGRSYTFAPERPGSYTLEVVATDAGGATKTLTRQIRVSPPETPKPRTVASAPKPKPAAAPAPRVAPAPKPKPAATRAPQGAPAPKPEPKPELKVAAVPKPTPPKPPQLPPGERWRAGVRAALEEYEAALEQKDMKRLERVWLFSPGSIYRTRWESKFRRPDPLDISIEIRSMEKQSSDQVTVLFHQKESSPNRTRSYAYKAVLLERKTTGEWQIVENRLQKN